MNIRTESFASRRLQLLGLGVACILHIAVASATEIDLQCERSAQELVSRLDAAGLLVADGHAQAQSIARSICSDAQQSARMQQQTERKDLLSNILFQDTGGKAGNTRLRNLKR